MALLPGWNTWSLCPCISCCKQFWIPSRAAFGEGCLGIVAYIPTLIALIILVSRYGLGLLWRRRPLWLQDFAAEEKETVNAGLDLPPKARSWHPLSGALFLTSIVAVILSLLLSFVFGFGPLCLIPLIPNLVSCIIFIIDRPRSAPGSILFLHTLVLVVQLAILLAVPGLLRWPSNIVWVAEMLPSIFTTVTILIMPLRDTLMDDQGIALPFQDPTYDNRSPEDNFSLWHWMTVAWMGPLIKMAYARQLHDKDVWLLPYQFQHDRLHRLFRQVKGSVTTRILKANAPDLFITTGLAMLESAMALMPIILLKQILAALDGDTRNLRVAAVYAVISLCADLVRVQSGVFSLWFSRRCYERSRGEMITMVYEKTLRRKAFTIPSHTETWQENGHKPADKKSEESTDGPASMGKILNLMRNDVYEVAQRFWEFPDLIRKPLDLILSVVLLWNILGAASLLGILVLVVAQLLNYFVIRALIRWETRRRAITDLKLQITSQFIEAIRHLRWYDWQDKWLGNIFTQRQRELRYRVVTNLLGQGINFSNQIAASFFPVAAFYAYTVIGGQKLTADVAFPALNLFNALETSLRAVPALIAVLLNAAVAMRRIEGFMAEQDKEDGHDDANGPLGKLCIEIKGATFSWPGVAASVLENVSVTCKAGLTLVCGKVGTGKTALLQAILGEMDQRGGDKSIPEEMVGYCAQTPWLQSMSIRENILFCQPFDETRYKRVLDACCLLPDIAEFKARDLSMIGENGIGLSGGQKARVALARAVYSQARILLLDDPIAALDHQTAEAIMKRLFTTSGLMKDRMVVFVTHRVDLVNKYSYQVLEVREDKSVSTLDPEELASNDKLLQRVTSTEDDQEDISTFDGAADDVIPDKFIEEEHRAHGGVMASVYWRYVKAGKLRWWVSIIVCFIVFRISKVAYFYFLKIWGEAYQRTQGEIIIMVQAANLADARALTTDSGDWFSGINLGLPAPDVNVKPWLFWFGVLAAAQLIARTLGDIVLIVLTYTAGRKIFKDVMNRVSNATFRFFDVTPVGRLMNRVTSDIGTIDGQIAAQIHQCAWFSLNWLSAMLVIATTAPVFLVLALFMTVTFVLIFLRFLPASQSLRRLEMVSLSPLMSNFGALVEGLTTVRAFRAQPNFQQRNIATTDDFQKMDHFFWSLQAWLQFRFDALSALSTFALTITSLKMGFSSGVVGFVLAAAANFVNSTHTLCRRYGELQMQFVSVERVVELLDLDQENPGDVDPPAAWPTTNDDIVFDDVSIKYAPHLDPSLRNISMTIPAGSTVAVTGRTGSGKSTLALALLGTVLPEAVDGAGLGTIHIGGMDVSRVNKHALRRRISFVAQDPVLFPGTLRENLDPVGEHTDEECAQVLEAVMGGSGDFTIKSRVDGGGKNLSQGQRQLVGLGRAVLRRSPIVILDEATASIDMKTAFLIQEVLREELRHSTVITIAHRVEAVRDANFSVVLENGRVIHAAPTGQGE